MSQVAALCAFSEDPHAWPSQTGDKQFLFSETGDAFIMYAARGSSRIALGDPVEREALAWTFADQTGRPNARPVFYAVSGRNLGLWVELGLTLHKVGEEAVVRLPEVGVSGVRFKTMRATLNKRQRDGHEFAVLPAPHAPGLIEECARWVTWPS